MIYPRPVMQFPCFIAWAKDEAEHRRMVRRDVWVAGSFLAVCAVIFGFCIWWVVTAL